MTTPRGALIITELDPSVYPQPAYLAESLAGLLGSATLLTLSRSYDFRAGAETEIEPERRAPSYGSLSRLVGRALEAAARINPAVIIAVNEPLLPLLPLTIPFAPAAVRGAYLLDFWEDSLVTQTARLKAAHRLTAAGTRWLDFVIDCQAERLELRPWAGAGRLGRFVLHNMPPVSRIPADFPTRSDEGPPRIIYAGAGGTGACIEPMIEAMAGLDAPFEASLYLRAPESRIASLRAFAKSVGATDGIRIRAAIPKSDLLREIARSDIGLCLYATDATANVNTRLCSPNKLYEYIALGVAPLVSPNPTMRFVEKNGIGVCADGTDSGSIARGLRSMIEGDRYIAMGRAARAAFLEERFYECEFEAIAAYLKAELCL